MQPNWEASPIEKIKLIDYCVFCQSGVWKKASGGGLPANKTASCTAIPAYNTCEHGGPVYGSASTNSSGKVTILKNEFGSVSLSKILVRTMTSCGNKPQSNTVMVDSEGLYMTYSNGNDGALYSCTAPWI